MAVGRSRLRRDGFTLVELMIAFTVFAFGLIAVMMMQIQAMKDGTMGRHRTGATMLAQDQIELVQNMPFSDSDLDVMDPVAWTTVPWINGGQPDEGQVTASVSTPNGDVSEVTYTVSYRVQADDPSDPNPSLRLVDLEVTWTEDGVSNNKPTRTGQPTVAVSTVLMDNEK
jgi:Tfp pilus assembly protein PilV